MTTDLDRINSADLNSVRILTQFQSDNILSRGVSYVEDVLPNFLVHLRIGGTDCTCLYKDIKQEYAFTQDELEQDVLVFCMKDRLNYLITLKNLINQKEKLMETLNKIESYVEQTVECGKPSPCVTKIKLHNVVLDNKDLRGTITAMENYMSECGVLVGWEDNKDKYL